MTVGKAQLGRSPGIPAPVAAPTLRPTVAPATTPAAPAGPPANTGFEKPASPASARTLTPVSAGQLAKGGTLMNLRFQEVARKAPETPGVPTFNTTAFQKALDLETGAVARPGNMVEMLFDGTNSFAERNRLMDGAKSSINLQTFIFSSDDTGWELARRLAKKADEGVKVRVIYDAVGSNRADPAMFQLMKDHGVELRPHGELLTHILDINNRWHEKHLIVDGKTSIEGGMNIANEYALGGSGRQVFSRGETATEPWRDVDVKTEGPAVHDTQRAFLKNWASLGTPVDKAEEARLMPASIPWANGVSVRVVQHRPNEDEDTHTGALFLRTIANAKKSITIENAYFLPPPEIRQALKDAAKRGVEVKVMTNSRESNDTGFVSDASRYFYDEMMADGVAIFEKQGGTLHSKTATFDGQFSLVGSANLNGRSSGQDSEVVLAIDDPMTAAKLETRFETGMVQVKKVTQDELDQESFGTNLKQWAVSNLAWTF